MFYYIIMVDTLYHRYSTHMCVYLTTFSVALYSGHFKNCLNRDWEVPLHMYYTHLDCISSCTYIIVCYTQSLHVSCNIVCWLCFPPPPSPSFPLPLPSSLLPSRDKLSSFMESRGAPSPGILALTSNLSKVYNTVYLYFYHLHLSLPIL